MKRLITYWFWCSMPVLLVCLVAVFYYGCRTGGDSVQVKSVDCAPLYLVVNGDAVSWADSLGGSPMVDFRFDTLK